VAVSSLAAELKPASAVVQSADGESYEMSGAGVLKTQSKSVTATGTFTHKSSGGTVLETGVWIDSELVSFDSYGIAPGALLGAGRAFGPPPLGPKRMPMLLGSMAAGARAVFRIRLLPVQGSSLERDAASELRHRQGASRTPGGRNKTTGLRGSRS